MNKLIVFGCSFTNGDGCLPHDPYFKKYKLLEDDLIWPEFVAKKLNLKLFNFGMGAIGNDYIIDSIIKNFDLINDGDIVIIQKTFSHRFDITVKSQELEEWKTITPNSENYLQQINYSKDDITSILKALTLMDSNLNNHKWIHRFEFFKNIIEKYKKTKACIVWDLESGYHKKWERIFQVDTNINDGHWSFAGHRTFAQEILEKINNYG